MDLDNYFARFLNKKGSLHTTRRPAVPTPVGAAGTAKDNGTNDVVCRGSPNAAQPPASPFVLRDESTSAALAEGVTTATSAPQQQQPQQPAKRLRLELTHSPGATQEEPVRAPDTHAAHTAQQPQRAASRDEGDDDDDNDEEDELDLLLGSEQARRIKAADARRHDGAQEHSPVALPTLVSCATLAHTTNTNNSGGDDDNEVVAIGALPWSTRSRGTLHTIAERFAQQMRYELHYSPELLASFEPFLRDRVLLRLAGADNGGGGGGGGAVRPALRPAVHAVEGVSKDSVHALPGCELRPYQVRGVQFLLDHFQRGMSCILSDDMGLGKTAQVAAFLHTLKQLYGIDGPHLVVTPLSTLTNWTRELARWAPTLRVVKYHGERQARREVRRRGANRHAVLVTTPAVVTQERGFFRKRCWVVAVVDEAHVLKGHSTRIATTARKLDACFRLAVTGTPVHNRVREVWSLTNFLFPALSASDDGRQTSDVQAAEECARLLQHIMLRRTKDALELGIPPRIDEPVTLLEPTYLQRTLLARLTDQALQLHGQGRGSSGGSSGTTQTLQGHFTHQRVVCNHPLALRLLALERGQGHHSNTTAEERLRLAGLHPLSAETLLAPSAKMAYLDALLRRLRGEGHRCLVFSNFTTTLDLLQALCTLRQYSYERLDGTCNRVERELAMLRYNAPRSTCFVFLATTTAGGVGVTLTGADTVILFDSHYNPQIDRQAADRAHRIGQTREVHVHRLCLRHTIEESIRVIAERKASLGDYIVDKGAARGASEEEGTLSAEAIRTILQDLQHPPCTASSRGTAGSVLEDHEQQQRCEADGGLTPPLASQQTNKEEEEEDSDSRAADDKLVAELVELERTRFGSGAAHAPSSPTTRQGGPLRGEFVRSTHCFVCDAIMHPYEPLYHCLQCPKSYHAECVHEPRPQPGEMPRRLWSCPRHACCLCGKGQAADGAIFMCVSCPRSFCFDCLDPRYLVLDDAGTALLHVRRTYPAMQAEGMEERRSCYYITCLHCAGVASSSEGEDDEGEATSETESVVSEAESEAGLL